MHAPITSLVPSLVEMVQADRLRWIPDAGVGFYPVRTGTQPYNDAYFEKYVGYAATDMGRKITEFRVAFVNDHYTGGDLIDVGIGSGSFVEARSGARGFDVCPRAIRWLEERGKYRCPYLGPVEAVTLFDVLEHIADFRPLLANVTKWLFVSIPIYEGDPRLIHKWKHFRADEHFWLFTHRGFKWLMKDLGWSIYSLSETESMLGRKDIITYALRRD